MLTAEYDKLKRSYREIFLESAGEIRAVVESVRPKGFVGDIFKAYEIGSIGFNWQQTVLSVLDVRYCGYKKSGLCQIQSFRDECNCTGCGVCCKFAVSEFTPEELKLKAEKGDNFASQFISIFIPYENMNEVKNIYPEYIQMLKDNGESGYYFYHCPKLTEDKRCSGYENRPQICRDFPDNPLTILPKSCGFCEWKEKSEVMTLMLHAMIEIVEYYKSKIPV